MWQVRDAIDALPHDEATVVRMQHLDGLTHREISEKLGIALGHREVTFAPRAPSLADCSDSRAVLATSSRGKRAE